jgi:Skp family chaperone for outer membrane proteins
MTMNRFRTTAVALVSTLALGSFAAATVPAAFAGAKPAPCSTQQTQVDKATAKLDALAANFAAHPTKMNKRAEKAQAQRVAHAANRLANCLAAAPVA